MRKGPKSRFPTILSQVLSNVDDPLSPTNFYVTVPPHPFAHCLRTTAQTQAMETGRHKDRQRGLVSQQPPPRPLSASAFVRACFRAHSTVKV